MSSLPMSSWSSTSWISGTPPLLEFLPPAPSRLFFDERPFCPSPSLSLLEGLCAPVPQLSMLCHISSALPLGSNCLLDVSLWRVHRNHKHERSKPVAHHSSSHPETCPSPVLGTVIYQLPRQKLRVTLTSPCPSPPTPSESLQPHPVWATS